MYAQDTKKNQLARIYQSEKITIPARTFSVSDLEQNPETAMANVVAFFENQYVCGLLREARDSVFSRPERKTTPQVRFQEALHVFVTEVGEFKDGGFAGITEFEGALQYLKTIKATQHLYATNESREIQAGLREIMSEYAHDLARLRMRPNIFGSVIYGDATSKSDIDIDFLVSKNASESPDMMEIRRELGQEIDAAIDHQFDFRFQARDIIDKVPIVDLDEIRGILTDILCEDTTRISDYAYDGRNMYPFNWILEGESFAGELGEIDREVQEIQDKIIRATEIDPLFELLMGYSIFHSLRKRKPIMQ